MIMKLNSTSPLPYYAIIDNEIYTYNPEISEDDMMNHPTVKRARSISPRSLTAMFRRYNKGNNSNRSKLRFTHPITPPMSRSPSLKFHEEEQFSFTSSECESLPDLTADDSDYSDLIVTHDEMLPILLVNDVPNQQLHNGPSIFEIPEIVEKILRYVDIQTTVIPQEEPPIRRKPFNYQHASLIHGDSTNAQESLQTTTPQTLTHTNSLFNCLLVNKLFYNTIREIISENFYFSKEDSLRKYLTNMDNIHTIQFQPKSFVLHKLFHAKQPVLDKIDSTSMSLQKLKWLELYMCPKLSPPIRFITQSSTNLEKLVITGSKVIDNDFLIIVARNCPNLQYLDLRACEQVSDFGIYQLSMYVHKLRLINLGRKNLGNSITDTSIIPLVKRNSKLTTIGLAGCHIADGSIWEMARHCKKLERLSLNNCPHITNNSLMVFNSQASYFPRLSVLELRFNYQLSEWRGIIEFKRKQESKNMIMLIEVCDVLVNHIKQQEILMDKLISQRIFNDISIWVNSHEEDQEEQRYLELVRRKRSLDM